MSGPLPWATAGLANRFHLLGRVFLEPWMGSEGPPTWRDGMASHIPGFVLKKA